MLNNHNLLKNLVLSCVILTPVLDLPLNYLLASLQSSVCITDDIALILAKEGELHASGFVDKKLQCWLAYLFLSVIWSLGRCQIMLQAFIWDLQLCTTLGMWYSLLFCFGLRVGLI